MLNYKYNVCICYPIHISCLSCPCLPVMLLVLLLSYLLFKCHGKDSASYYMQCSINLICHSVYALLHIYSFSQPLIPHVVVCFPSFLYHMCIAWLHHGQSAFSLVAACINGHCLCTALLSQPLWDRIVL